MNALIEMARPYCGFCGEKGHAYTSCAIYAAMQEEVATQRCTRCNEMHDDSPLALAMCRSAAAVLDEADRPGSVRVGIYRALNATYQQHYAAWRGGSV